MTKNITPLYKIIPISLSVFLEDDGLGTRVGGVGSLGGKLATEVNDASVKAENAINSDYDLITDVINARLDTAAKTILGDFTFGASGALQIGIYEAGVSGDVKISPAGILARDKDNATTIAIDGTTGNVTMSGTITAIAGYIGGWAISTTAIYYDGATDAVSAGMASADYPFYAGKKYADRATAPFRVTPDGALVATSATITGSFTINNPGDIDQTSLGNSAAAGATVGANWSSNLSNIPNTLGAPAGTGLFLSTSYMGYYTDSTWTTYIKSDGTFYFKGDDDNYVYWNGSALNVRGTLNADDITAGTLTGRTIQTATDGLRMKLHYVSADVAGYLDYMNSDEVLARFGAVALYPSGGGINLSLTAADTADSSTNGMNVSWSGDTNYDGNAWFILRGYRCGLHYDATDGLMFYNEGRYGNEVTPNKDNTYDIGSTTRGWKDLYIDGNIIVGGTVDGVNIAAHKARHYAGGADAVIRTDQSSGSNLGISSGWAYTHDNNASAHHTAFTASDARTAINNVIGSDGHLDATLDCDGYDITDVDLLTVDEITMLASPYKIAGSYTSMEFETSASSSGGMTITPGINGLKVAGKMFNTSQTQIDQDIWEGGTAGTYSLLVSNNSAAAKAGFGFADGWETYSEYTEIEKVASEYNNLTEDKAKKIILSYIKEEAIMKVDAAEKDPGRFVSNTKAGRDNGIAKYRKRILNKDWTNKVNLAYKQKRFSILDKGTVLAFSDNGAIPTKERGQTNIMGVIAKSPCIIAHAEDEGINVTKFGHTSAKVKGVCSAGDVLWTSNEKGCLEKAINPIAGQIVARARESKNTEEVGIIEIDLTL